MPDTKPVWRVVETIPENNDVTSVVIEAPEGTPVYHKPGQFASIRVMTENGWSEPHPFTISCDAHDSRLRFTVKSIGDFTAGVRDWKPGTPVQCSGPMGVFCKDIDSQKHIVMIAGGVGITPFLAVLRHAVRQGVALRGTLLWTNRRRVDAFASEELEALGQELGLHTVFVLTREPWSDSTAAGVREQGRMDVAMLRRHFRGDERFFLCGPPGMQRSVLDGLHAAFGIRAGDVQREIFAW